MAEFTWGTIKDWNGDDLSVTLQGLSEDRGKAVNVHDSIGGIDVKSGWEGKGAHAAGGALGRLKDSCAHYLGLVGDLIQATATAQDGVNQVKSMVAEILAMAAENDLIIDENGSVRINLNSRLLLTLRSSGLDALVIQRLQMKQQECAEKILRACEKAAEVDSTYTSALDAVSEGRDSDPEGFDDPTPGLPDLPRKGASTEEVAAWWNSLTKTEQDAVVKKAKDEIAAGHGHDGKYAALGNMNGITPSTRADINEDRFRKYCKECENLKRRKDEILDKAKKKRENHYGVTHVVDNFESLESYLNSDELKEIEDIDRKCAEADSINAALAKTDDQKHKTRLLMYDPANGQVGHDMTHVAYGVGDIDNADYTAYGVPGTSTTIKSSSDWVDNMTNLKNRAEAENPGSSVAAVAYIGYDCPPGLHNAVFRDRAERGGEELARHLEGMADARAAAGNPTSLSLFGHSYGSLAGSYAAREVRPGVLDSYTAQGSPGSIAPASDLNVPEGKAYSLMFPDDLMGRVDDAWEVLTPYKAPLGLDTSEPPSGYTNLDPGQHGDDIKAHSSYLIDGSQAQKQLVDVIMGKSPGK